MLSEDDFAEFEPAIADDTSGQDAYEKSLNQCIPMSIKSNPRGEITVTFAMEITLLNQDNE